METIELLWWHWVVVAGFLLAMELIGAGGFLLGFAAAALLMIGVTFITPVVWYWQLTMFAVVGAAASYAYIKRFKAFNTETDAPELNDRMAQLIGQRGAIVEVGTSLKVQIGDTLWQIKTNPNVSVGDKVTVIALEGTLLVVE